MGLAARKASGQYAIERATQILLSHYKRLVSEAAPRKRNLGFRIRNVIERLRA